MGDVSDPRVVRDTSEIARKILFAQGRVVFLIGAGCSISAGIPGVSGIASGMIQLVAARMGYCEKQTDHIQAYKILISKNAIFSSFLAGPPGSDPTDQTIDWYKVYDEMFRSYYTAPDDVRDLFDTIVSKASGAINWAHLCLGELVAQGYVSTVLTTNFDQLVLSGMVRAGVIPVVCDGIESLNRIVGAPRHPQLVELHGSRHCYLLRNSHEDVTAASQNPQARRAISNLIQHATTFVAIGYGGREESVMELLTQGAQAFPDKHLVWVNHSENPNDISIKVREFLSTSKHALHCVGQDADTFFLELCKNMEIGSPPAISNPLEAIRRGIDDVRKSKVVVGSAIQAEIDSRRHVWTGLPPTI
jgi:SIR2-like domain